MQILFLISQNKNSNKLDFLTLQMVERKKRQFCPLINIIIIILLTRYHIYDMNCRKLKRWKLFYSNWTSKFSIFSNNARNFNKKEIIIWIPCAMLLIIASQRQSISLLVKTKAAYTVHTPQHNINCTLLSCW